MSQDEIIEKLNLEKFYHQFKEFYDRNKERKFETLDYVYTNREGWAKCSDKELLTLSHEIFIQAMRYVFPEQDIPLLTLHIARKNSHISLFDYIGEFLDVLPVIIGQEKKFSLSEEIETKLSFIQNNDISFSSLFYSDCDKGFGAIAQMLSEIHQMTKYLLVYNNTGILKSSNNIVVNSEKYRIFYNVMSVVIYNDGIFMNIPVEHELKEKLQKYLDQTLDQMLS